MRIFTVGHSTRSLAELVEILSAHGVRLLVDIRRYPASRRHPHFSRESFEQRLPLGYLWLDALGGRRSRRKDSPHTAWEVPAFAGYADHMETPGFLAAAAVLLERAAADGPAAVMCAEAHPSQCHRRVLSDWLVAQGHEVVHLLGVGRTEPHTLTSFARVVQEGARRRVVYDKGQLTLDQIRTPRVKIRSRSRES